VPAPAKDKKSIRKKLSPDAKSEATWSRDVPVATALPAPSFSDQALSPPEGAR
jgi:hypothetical protein